jgi:hypothetical protein
MTHQRMGHAKEAEAHLKKLRERMKDARWAKDAESQGFLREAEMLVSKGQVPVGESHASRRCPSSSGASVSLPTSNKD